MNARGQAGNPNVALVKGRRDVRLAWTVHLFTASGVVVGMLALESVFQGRVRAAIAYLLITQLIDGLDGPLARRVDIENCVPRIDGYVLDLVIDYVTCVIVPAAFAHQFGLFPDSWSLALAGLIVFTSAIWFSRTDMMTDEHWFRGFPATWNLLIPTLWFLGLSPVGNAIAVGGLAVLQLTNAPFPHVVRSSWARSATFIVTAAWLLTLALATAGTEDLPRTSVRVALALFIAYFAALSFARARQQRTIPS